LANTLKFFIVGDDSDGSKTLKSFDANVQSTTDSLEKMGLAAIAATAALSLKEATEFETKMAEVSTLLDDTSALEGMEQAVKDLAIEYGQFPDDQVEAIYSIISAGAEDATEAVMTLEAANKLAIGGVTDVAIAADGLTSALNAYGEEAGTATDVSDAMFVAMKAGKTTIGELSANLGNVAPIAAEAGVGLDELLGATAALTKTGATTSSSMNGLRQVIASILKPTAEAEEEAKKLGLVFNSTALESKGLQGFLEDLTAKTGGNKDSLTQLFGSVEALGPIFALTGSQAGAFSEIMEDMENKTGATDVAFSKIQETGGQAFDRLAALANVAAINIGNELLPAAADLANFFIGPVSDGVSKVEEAFFFLKSSAFAVMGGVADSILSIIGPLAEVQDFLNDIMGIESRDSAFISLAEDLEMFSAAMEEGAVETFKARDAAVEHTIELRKQADAMRGISEEIDAVVQKKADAEAQDTENDALIAERKAEIREQELELVKQHEDGINEIKEESLTEAQGFLELSTGLKLATIIQGGSDVLSSVAQTSKTAFEVHKALSLASAAISLPSSVLQSFENGGGYPWGLIPAGLMAAKGALEIQAINASTYTGQAHGGTDRVAQDQTALLKEGEMVLDPGTSEAVRQQVTNGGVGGGVTVVIENFNLTVSAIMDVDGIDWEKTAEQKMYPAFKNLFRRDVFLPGVTT
jgi:TP901 family phage tail tape measure protein